MEDFDVFTNLEPFLEDLDVLANLEPFLEDLDVFANLEPFLDDLDVLANLEPFLEPFLDAIEIDQHYLSQYINTFDANSIGKNNELHNSDINIINEISII